MKYLNYTLILFLFLASCASNKKSHYIITESQLRDPNARLKYDELAAERGKAIYLERCITCHGPDGRAKTGVVIDGHRKPVDLVKKINEIQSVDFLVKFSRWTNMPGWEQPLAEEDEADLTEYLKKLAVDGNKKKK